MTAIRDRWAEIDDSVRRAVATALAGVSDTRFDEAPLLAAEAELRHLLGLPEVLLTSSATAAAHAVFLRSRADGGARLGLPAHVFPGVAGAAVTAGLDPVFVPVNRDLIADAAGYGSCDVALVHFPWGDVRGAADLAGRLPQRLVVLDVSHATPRVPRRVWERFGTVAAVGSLGAGKFLSGMEMGFVASDSRAFLRSVAALGAVRREGTFDVPAPVATKLRPHPLAVAVLRAQLCRLPAKLEAHDETWEYLAPRLAEVDGVRVVTTSAQAERVFWRCLLDVDSLDGDPAAESDLVKALRARGLPASRPEYLDEAVSWTAACPRPATTREALQARGAAVPPPIPRRYLALPGFVRLPPPDCDELLRGLEAGLRDFRAARRTG
ncbi:DegT/DnrJ/EryC1/StrS family aminotransferase [Streptomyces sp. NBC_01455]|uniref:DegT/DnrJ/EryC1/StrS family aminotransferase n=1 Tax=Streptomyces sp. NBC_01455 TaxID=2903874 RepID=UPI002E3704D4|nr:DegT/DnrJ/EryC1/StrS family aminotransferase [Streptomyces sp. NBC_01455]